MTIYILYNVIFYILYVIKPTDKLIGNLVTEAIERDKKDNMNKAPCDRQSFHLNNLTEAICGCGVSFTSVGKAKC